jgi:putative flippase GtrA
MSVGHVEVGEPTGSHAPDRLRRFAEMFPRPLRFVGVGGCGLITDVGVLTIFIGLGFHPLVGRLFSLAIATLITWRLNRALTFDRSGRAAHDEAFRYAVVTAVAQSTSYTIFAAFVLTMLARHPQIALCIGAVGGAVISYNGHRLFAFAPRRARAS